jgi:hypothetical protein
MRISTALCSMLLAAATFGQDAVPKKGYVPDSATALKVAEAVLIPVYGQQKVDSQRPFSAKLENDVWTVDGTLYCSDRQLGSQLIVQHCNGLLEVRISKSDAHVLSMLPKK